MAAMSSANGKSPLELWVLANIPWLAQKV